MTNQPQPQSIARNEPFQLQNILVPTDFSPESLKALRYGIAFARQFSAILSLAHIAERPPATAGFEAVPIALDDPEYLRKAEQELARFAAEHLPNTTRLKPVRPWVEATIRSVPRSLAMETTSSKGAP